MQTDSKVGTGTLILGNSSYIMQKTFHTWFTLVSGYLSHGVHNLNVSNCQFESQSALTFSKIVFQFYKTKKVPCSKCDFAAMSSGEKDSLNLGFPY